MLFVLFASAVFSFIDLIFYNEAAECLKLGSMCGQMASVCAFYSPEPSSNPPEIGFLIFSQNDEN